MSEQAIPKFPCDALPEDASTARLLGLYPQRQQGLWMQRLKITGGRLSATQWHALAEVATEFTPAVPLHLTTRQDIELHDLTADKIPLLQAKLAVAGMTSLGACGDTLRNITVCPCSGLLSGRVDLMPIALEIRRTLEESQQIWSLPRKFKIGLSCKEDCGRPWINDLGFIARGRDGRWGFCVIAAGSLGARPATGIRLLDWIEPSDALPLTAAAIEVFAAHGDRANRGKARLRHVRRRVGDQQFRSLMLEAFGRERAKNDWPQVAVPEASAGLEETAVLRFANGDLSPDAARALGEMQAQQGFEIRIADHHQIHVFAGDRELLADRLTESRALGAPFRRQVSVVACPGIRCCSRALVDTNEAADSIRGQLADKLSAGTEVCVSGCPNGCAHSAVAAIGLVGRVISDGGSRHDAFDLFLGGGEGRNNRLATLAATKVSSRDVVSEIARRL